MESIGSNSICAICDFYHELQNIYIKRYTSSLHPLWRTGNDFKYCMHKYNLQKHRRQQKFQQIIHERSVRKIWSYCCGMLVASATEMVRSNYTQYIIASSELNQPNQCAFRPPKIVEAATGISRHHCCVER